MSLEFFCSKCLPHQLYSLITIESERKKKEKYIFEVFFFLSARAKNNDGMGNEKASGRESKSCLSRIFDLRLDLFV